MSTITIVSIVCSCVALGINLFINLPLMIWSNKVLNRKLGKTKKQRGKMKTLAPLKWDCVTKTKRNGQVWQTHCDYVFEPCCVICGETEKERQKNAKITFKEMKKIASKKGTVIVARCGDVVKHPFKPDWVCPMRFHILEKGKKPKWERTNLTYRRGKNEKKSI